jgi:hypothetical protein
MSSTIVQAQRASVRGLPPAPPLRPDHAESLAPRSPRAQPAVARQACRFQSRFPPKREQEDASRINFGQESVERRCDRHPIGSSRGTVRLIARCHQV